MHGWRLCVDRRTNYLLRFGSATILCYYLLCGSCVPCVEAQERTGSQRLISGRGRVAVSSRSVYPKPNLSPFRRTCKLRTLRHRHSNEWKCNYKDWPVWMYDWLSSKCKRSTSKKREKAQNSQSSRGGKFPGGAKFFWSLKRAMGRIWLQRY